MGRTHTADENRPNILLNQMDEDQIERHPAPGYCCDDPNCETDHEHERVSCGTCGRHIGYVEVSGQPLVRAPCWNCKETAVVVEHEENEDDADDKDTLIVRCTNCGVFTKKEGTLIHELP